MLFDVLYMLRAMPILDNQILMCLEADVHIFYMTESSVSIDAKMCNYL